MIFRQLSYLVAITIFTLWYGFKVMIAAVRGVKQRPGGVYDESCRRWSRKVLRWSGIQVNTKGFDRLPAGKPVVFVANHQ